MTRHLMLTTAAAAASLAVLGTAAPALAQEASPWSGFYVGGNLGGSWGDTSATVVTSPGTGTPALPAVDASAINAASHSSSNKTAFTGGVEGGYNYRSGDWLFGIETDWGVMNLSETATSTTNAAIAITPPVTYTIHQRVSTDWIWTLRPRIGIITDQWLFYATAGMAVANIKSSTQYDDTRASATSLTLPVNGSKTGWTAGLGGAYAFTPNWSIKGEWLYADFGHVSGAATSANGFVTVSTQASVKANMFRMGVDYRF